MRRTRLALLPFAAFRISVRRPDAREEPGTARKGKTDTMPAAVVQ